MPDFKTIADFRKDNGPAIKATCRQFVVLCRRLDLFSETVIAIDGSRFKAVNTRDKNYTHGAIERRMEQVEASIARYLSALDTADRQEGEVAKAKSIRLKDKLARLKQQMQHLREMEIAVQAAPDRQISLTDPDARAMATSGKGTGIVGYNVQTAVDVEHHLIVAHEVTNVGHDRTQLVPMAVRAQEATGNKEITVLADRGYFNGDQVLACENTGVLPCVPKTLTSGNAKRGLFTGQDFIYDAETDYYTCPAGEHLTRGLVRSDRRGDIDHYRHLTACFTCPLKPKCTPDKLKRIKRWKHEWVLDAMQARLDRMPDAMGVRRQTVEHPFGTIKAWSGGAPTRRPRVRRGAETAPPAEKPLPAAPCPDRRSDRAAPLRDGVERAANSGPALCRGRISSSIDKRRGRFSVPTCRRARAAHRRRSRLAVGHRRRRRNAVLTAASTARPLNQVGSARFLADTPSGRGGLPTCCLRGYHPLLFLLATMVGSPITQLSQSRLASRRAGFGGKRATPSARAECGAMGRD